MICVLKTAINKVYYILYKWSQNNDLKIISTVVWSSIIYFVFKKNVGSILKEIIKTRYIIRE